MFETNLEKKPEKGTLGLVLLGPIFGMLYIFFLPIMWDHDPSSGAA